MVNCTVAHLKTAGSVDINTAVAVVYFSLTLAIAALESVFVTVLPVLGGEQGDYVFVYSLTRWLPYASGIVQFFP